MKRGEEPSLPAGSPDFMAGAMSGNEPLPKGNLLLPSSALCRSQEAFYRDQAFVNPLANVRVIAASAAEAWAREAQFAEERENRVRIKGLLPLQIQTKGHVDKVEPL